MQKRALTSFDFLAEFTGNDRQFMREMVEIFLQETPNYLQQLQVHLNAKEWVKIGDLAHSLKTPLRYMGVGCIQTDILLLEEYGRQEKKLDQIPGLVAKVCDVSSKAMVELSQKKRQL